MFDSRVAYIATTAILLLSLRLVLYFNVPDSLVGRGLSIDELVSRWHKLTTSLDTNSPIKYRTNKQLINNLSSSTNQCKYNFTVYVYPTPDHLSSIRISEEARTNNSLHVCRRCILRTILLEYILYDFFTQFCGRTSDPSSADFFYLPIVRDAELRWLMQNSGGRDRPPFPAEKALLDLLENNNSSLFQSYFQVTDEYWRRNGGADHIIVMPAPVTNLRHERSQRGFFHYMLHLHTPIFIAVEYSRSFINEYPVCSKLKNIIVPYPTIDPELYSYRWRVQSAESNRSALIYYAGGLHGDCMEVREALHHLVINASKVSGIVHSHRLGMHRREEAFLTSTFCPVPIGDSPTSKRMYDVMNFGCIPVILSDDLLWAFSIDVGGDLNHTAFQLQLPQSIVQYTVGEILIKFDRAHFPSLPASGINTYDLLKLSADSGGDYVNGIYVNPLIQLLSRVPFEDILFYRKNMEQFVHLFRYYKMKSMNRIPIAYHRFPDGGAIDMMVNMLKRKNQQSLTMIRDACLAERALVHSYIAHYPCDRKPKKPKKHKKYKL